MCVVEPDVDASRRHRIARLIRDLPTPTRWKRTLFYLVSDATIVFCASLLTYWAASPHGQFSSDFTIPDVLRFSLVGLGCQVAIGLWLTSYSLKWSTFSLTDVPRNSVPTAVAAILLGCLIWLGAFPGVTPWAALTWGLLTVGGVLAVRSSRRFYAEVIRRRPGKRAILVVCSDKGYFLLDLLRRIPHSDHEIVGFVDPERRNTGAVSQGMPVLGTFAEIDRIVARHRVQTAFVFQGSEPAFAIGRFHQRLHELGVEVRLIPSLADLVNGCHGTDAQERLAIHELTGRPPVTVDPWEMQRVFGGKRILITGAGGSVGSELCRQLARTDPALVVLFERDDSNLFCVERQLRADYPSLDLLPFLGDITREDDVSRIFQETRPDIVFHAAAYKHVPILEFHPAEAFRANVQGSHVVAKAAVKYGASSFVYVSTDKAVNPTSVMGASKRIGEMVVTSMNGLGDVRFLAVRFGNVLASRGSVSTIFHDAISRRQPIAVTHPEMKRYFMLTSEAVLLVMQAVAIGRGGEVFVLDMGNPVRIVDLAETMVRLAGLRPHVDIPIVISGQRPGEKLFEETLTAEEGTVATANRRIYQARISRDCCYPDMVEELRVLDAIVDNAEPEQVRAEIMRHVRTYQPDTSCLKGRPTASGSTLDPVRFAGCEPPTAAHTGTTPAPDSAESPADEAAVPANRATEAV